ncbi:dienelactone hydrolase family protein [Glaciimonas sp. PAMC28666]|uniref:dienelactone hydrolase family protein n=1 Tax=Glaciimonas sp. PAMC28666 TaxID=2807626 RepID=UPI001F035451|nr:dienelactone hydrolase family protein [Glaciimonas sp. PAMC28666]
MSIKRLCQWRDATAYLRVTMALLMMSCVPTLPAYAQTPIPQTVYFPSADGKTELVGYLFMPVTPGPYPAVVMLHGRGGPYSANINAACSQVGRDQKSPCDGTNLSKRHMMWGEYWATHGYVALHVDSFGPRGRGHGYGRGTHGEPDRDAVNELTVRPLDATGALTYLVQRKDILPNHVMLQGWSNGGSTALNVMLRQTQSNAASAAPEFRAALVFYPGCGPRALASQRYQANSPIWIFLGSDDEEVSPSVCANILRNTRSMESKGHDTKRVEVVWYDGATHDFDDPGAKRQAIANNRIAKDDSMRRAAGLFDDLP